MQIRLPMSGNAEASLGSVLLRTATSAIPPGIGIPEGLPKVCRVPFRDELSGTKLRKGEPCPRCHQVRYVRNHGRLILCPVCQGSGTAAAVVQVVVVEDPDVLGMPKTSELVKSFTGIDGVYINSILLLKATACGVDPKDKTKGTAKVWVEPSGRAFPPPRPTEFGLVFETYDAAGLYLQRESDGGHGWVEYVGAAKGCTLYKEKIVNFKFQFRGNSVEEVETIGEEKFGGYLSASAKEICENREYGFRLGDVILRALPLAIQKSRESSDPADRLRRAWSGSRQEPRPECKERPRPEKPEPKQEEPAAPAAAEQPVQAVVVAATKCPICNETSGPVQLQPIDGKEELMCDKCWKLLGEETPVSTKCCNCDHEGTEREVAGRKMVMCESCWSAANGGAPAAEPEKPKKRAPEHKAAAA